MLMVEVKNDRSNDSKSNYNEKGDDMIMILLAMRMAILGEVLIVMMI